MLVTFESHAQCPIAQTPDNFGCDVLSAFVFEKCITPAPEAYRQEAATPHSGHLFDCAPSFLSSIDPCTPVGKRRKNKSVRPSLHGEPNSVALE